MKLIFGGIWNNSLQGARIAYRDGLRPDLRFYYLGLRLAKTPLQRMAP